MPPIVMILICRLKCTVATMLQRAGLYRAPVDKTVVGNDLDLALFGAVCGRVCDESSRCVAVVFGLVVGGLNRNRGV